MELAREKKAGPGSEALLREFLHELEEARRQTLAAGNAGFPPETPTAAKTPESPVTR